MAESNLFLTAGDFCSSFSRHRGKMGGLGHLVKLQKGTKGRLYIEKTDHQCAREGGKQTRNTDAQVGDSFVDCLLLRNLFGGVGRARCNNKESFAHLIVGNGFSEFIHKPSNLPGIRTLIYEPSRGSFGQQLLRSPFNPLKCATKEVCQGIRVRDRQTYQDNSKRRLASAWSPPLVATSAVCLSLYKWGIRSSTFSSTSLNSCGHPCKS